ncbi:MAG TPA: hypothetical protein VK087_05445 [Tissierellaceae bacterium]|nr:hypothetical protein [Tissierellaceae bacterium]
MDKEKEMVEIWGDIVDIKSLILAIVISSILTMGLYFLAPAGDQMIELFLGLGGAVLGFIISSIIIKPKRIIILEKDIKE